MRAQDSLWQRRARSMWMPLAVIAAAGAACGIAAWALRFALGRVRSGREGDTSEAAR